MGKVANQALDQVAQGPVVSCRVSCSLRLLLSGSPQHILWCELYSPQAIAKIWIVKASETKGDLCDQQMLRLHITYYHAL